MPIPLTFEICKWHLNILDIANNFFSFFIMTCDSIKKHYFFFSYLNQNMHVYSIMKYFYYAYK